MPDWAALIGTAASGFIVGMTAAWRIASVEATKIWVEDLRHRFQVKKEDREKQKEIRHNQLDEEHARERARNEDKRKRRGTVLKELQASLTTARQASNVYVYRLDIDVARMTGDAAAHAQLQQQWQEYLQVLATLRGHLTKLAVLGVPVKSDADWNEPTQHQIKQLIDHLSRQAETYASGG
ncbi:hypothetical protein AB0N17_09935 [Streptomyces sp. NPDC051133]|uniref:hypothetical protein n=1 Tax=Streptomyces sp. NPDC051133 TaxID=3155521 RepID=UPI0034205785